jgi:gluconate 2-dehydrogenase gamma chain
MPEPLRGALIGRRALLSSTAMALLLSCTSALSLTVVGRLPWEPDAGTPPQPIRPGGWTFFTADEAATVEALVDRLIPPDPKTPGGKEAGCAVFIDRQLAGPFGRAEGLYMAGPFHDGTPQQGSQSPLTPAALYRVALAALDGHCRAAFAGKHFAELSDTQKDAVLAGLEKGEIKLEGADGKVFFDHLLSNAQEGFFADPVYGGNRNMVGWTMIGFPGARYDYRDWVERHNERYPLPPVSITGRRGWTR